MWKDIKGYEGVYQVSTDGNVRSLDRLVFAKNKSLRSAKGIVLILGITIHGYHKVGLNKDGIHVKTRSVHRLVAETFIPNPENKPQVNHIDGNKKNNNIENLEWATVSENELHSYRIGLQTAPWVGKFGKDHNTSKPILQLDLNGNILNRFECGREAEEYLKVSKIHFADCANGKRKTSCGYKWKYAS